LPLPLFYLKTMLRYDIISYVMFCYVMLYYTILWNAMI